MNTDEYKTYECEWCNQLKPVDQVHNVCNEYPVPSDYTTWVCRRCILDKVALVTCEKCGADDRNLYKISCVPLCGPCITEMETVKDTLDVHGNLRIDEFCLCTDEPGEECSFTEEEWEALAEEGV